MACVTGTRARCAFPGYGCYERFQHKVICQLRRGLGRITKDVPLNRLSSIRDMRAVCFGAEERFF
jgi:hypothetical protein